MFAHPDTVIRNINLDGIGRFKGGYSDLSGVRGDE